MGAKIIGGADGPTSIFFAGTIGLSWINLFGLFMGICILIPNFAYTIKAPQRENKCTNKGMNLLEQVGRYTSLFLFIFNIGILEYGFPSFHALIFYYISNIMLLLSYWIIWILYFREVNVWKTMALCIIPTTIFLLSGITERKYLLVVSAVIFGIGHIYVSYQNVKK